MKIPADVIKISINGILSAVTGRVRWYMIFKTVDIPCPMATWWLTTEESQNTEFMCALTPVIRQYQRKGYVTATFLSGEQDLECCTHQLMKHNYELRSSNASLVPFLGCKAVAICYLKILKMYRQHLYLTLLQSGMHGIISA